VTQAAISTHYSSLSRVEATGDCHRCCDVAVTAGLAGVFLLLFSLKGISPSLVLIDLNMIKWSCQCCRVWRRGKQLPQYFL